MMFISVPSLQSKVLSIIPGAVGAWKWFTALSMQESLANQMIWIVNTE